MFKRFEFRPLSTAITLAMLALLIWLGSWQLSRADEKRATLRAFDQTQQVAVWRNVNEPPPRYTQVSISGRYDEARQVLLDGVRRRGQAGVEVLTPLRLDNGDIVMVNRGWTPWAGSRSAPPTPPAPSETVTVTGRVRNFAEPGMRLGDGNASIAQSWPRLAIYPGGDEISQWLGAVISPVLVLLDADASHGFEREWRPDEFPPSRHVGYAVQWYSLAVALVVLFLIACRKRADKGGGQ